MRYDKQKQIVSRQDGFSLMEVLVVIVIFSVGILGAMSMQTMAVTTNATTRKSTLAVEYATDTMERLMYVGTSIRDKYKIDDDGDGSVDEADEEDDGIDNDNDGTVDNEVVWHHMPEFAVGGPYTRGTNIPVNAYYASIFTLSWDITDIDCDGDGIDDSKRIDMIVTWDNNTKQMSLSSIRANML